MRKIIVLCIAGIWALGAFAQHGAIKTNAVYAATTTPNLGVEWVLGNHYTMDVTAGYNPFSLGENSQLKHWMVSPELRYWTCEAMNGHFLGLHGVFGDYNMSGWKIPFAKIDMTQTRYAGEFWGIGLSYGYQWILNNHFGIEATVGGGYANVHVEKFKIDGNGAKQGDSVYGYILPTRLGLSLMYVF